MHKLIGLQWARGLAAMAVVVGHSIAYPLPQSPGIALYMGTVGVTLFFVISGFIMVTTTGQDAFDFKAFALKRLLRIVPLYYFVTAVTFATVLVAPDLFKQTVFDIPHLISSLLFIPSFRPHSAEIVPFVKLGWTLNYEMFFYACFAALWFLNARQRVATLTIVFGVLIAIGIVLNFDNAILQFYTRVNLLGFLAGMWVALAIQRGVWPSTELAAKRLLAVAILVMLALVPVFLMADARSFAQPIVVAFCALAVGSLATITRFKVNPVSKALTMFGDASYSIYLFHLFGVGAAVTIAGRLLHWPLWAAIVAGAVAGTVTGLLGYYVVERQLTKWFGYKSRRRAISQVNNPALAQ